MSRPKFLPTAVIATVLTTVSVGLAAGADDRGSAISTGTAGAVAPVAEVQPDQAAAFGVLRRPQTAEDQLPPQAAAALAMDATGTLGVNPALSRLVVSAGGASTYLVPGDGWLCLVSADGLLGCNRTDKSVAGYLISSQQVDGRTTRIRAAIPDGTRDVAIRMADKSTRSARPQANAVLEDVASATDAITYSVAGQSRAIPLPSMPQG